MTGPVFTHPLPIPQTEREKSPAGSPQLSWLCFQDDAVGLVVQDHLANVAAIEAGPGGADAAGQEGVHGGGLVGARDVHGGRGQRSLLDDLVDVPHRLKDAFLVTGEKAQHPPKTKQPQEWPWSSTLPALVTEEPAGSRSTVTPKQPATLYLPHVS